LKRHILGSFWDRGNRNGTNDNFEYLFGEVSTVQSLTADLSRMEREVNTLTNLNRRTDEILREAQRVNGMNNNVQRQIDDLIINAGESDAEVVQARGEHDLLRGRFEEIEDKRDDYNFTSNAPMPPKVGAVENHYKLVRKISEDELEIFQKTNNGYLRYLYKRNTGGNGSNDYGVDHEALRLIKVEPISSIILFKRVDNPSSGTVKSTYDWAEPHANSTNLPLFRAYHRDDNKLFHPPGNETALQPYEINAGNSATYRIRKGRFKKTTVSFFYRQNASGSATHEVNIRVGGEIVKTVQLTPSFSQTQMTVEFPTFDRTGSALNPLDVTIENTSSYKVYLMGFNLSPLENHEGEDVDSFIATGSVLNPFIDQNGASDYAMKNAENGKNFGSYHGGEVSNRLDVMWRDDVIGGSQYRAFNDINVGEWCTIEDFSIRKIGILIDRAYIHARESFSVDGTVNMAFSYQVMQGKTPIPFIDFWTALTCTHPSFRILRFPYYMNLKDESGHKYFRSTEGLVIQEAEYGTQELHSRYTRFNNEFSTMLPNSISVQSQYNKHYYAPIRNHQDDSRPVAPEVLQFSKALDFYVH